WASGWLWGLVPPSTIETASKCPQGVAKVETQLSFLNQLVEGLTLGIYSPMSIKVTCAQSGHASAAPGAAEIVVPPSAPPDERKSAVQHAAELSLETGSPVFLRFEQDASDKKIGGASRGAPSARGGASLVPQRLDRIHCGGPAGR